MDVGRSERWSFFTSNDLPRLMPHEGHFGGGASCFIVVFVSELCTLLDLDLIRYSV